MDFDPVERYYDLSSEEIARIQEKKLREMVRYQLYPFSPYYKRLFDEKGIDPNSINTVKDLERIPLTKKEDIMPTEDDPNRYKDIILSPDLEKIMEHWPRMKLIRMKLSDLTGGDPKKELAQEYYPNFMINSTDGSENNFSFMFTSRDIRQFSNAYRSLQDVVGMEDEWVILNCFPFGPHIAFTFMYWLNIFTPLRIYHCGGDALSSTEKALDMINAVDANVIVGFPSYINYLLRRAKGKATDLSGIKLVLIAGERTTKGSKKKIEQLLKDGGAQDFTIYDIYLSTEMRDALPECTPGSGVYHIHPNLHIAEIVDPLTGKQKRPGERGHLVITNIDGRGSTICRYLIGDIFEGGILYGKCPLCGSNIPRIRGPIGRMKDYSKKMSLTEENERSVNLDPLYDILHGLEGIVDWQVSIEKKNKSDLDILKVKIAIDEGVDRKELAKQIEKKIKDAMEIPVSIDTSTSENELLEMWGSKIKPERIVDNRPSR